MKKIFICLIISLSIAILLFFISSHPFYKMLELKLYDVRMNLRKPPPQDDRILYVEMDEQAVKSLGRWPWPRDINAHLIDTLQSLGAKQIIFDLTFSSPAQLIVEKEEMKGVFQEKDTLKKFIGQVVEGVNKEEIKDKEDIVWYLGQINGGIEEFKGRVQERLNSALKDTDEILADSLKNSNSFMGYKFEVIYTPLDIKKDKIFPEVKQNILDWIKNNPDKNFRDLPYTLKNLPYFKKEEIQKVFLHLKIYNLLQKDIRLDMEKVSEKLNLKPGDINLIFNNVMLEAIKEKISSTLEKNPQAKITDIIWEYKIRNEPAIINFKNAWDTLETERAFTDKFGMPIDSPQNFLKAVKIDHPIFKFITAVKNSGFLNGIPDQDGILRKVPLFVKYNDKIYPHMSIASVISLLKPKELKFIPGKFLILKSVDYDGKTKDINIPIDKKTQMIINWPGAWTDTFSHISCNDVYSDLFLLRKNLEHNLAIPQEYLTPELKEIIKNDIKRLEDNEKRLRELVDGRICIVGLTAPGTHDYNPTPYEATYPMIGTHGTVINSILKEAFITQSTPMLDFLVLIVTAVLLTLFLSLLPAIGGLLVTIIFFISISFASLYLFNQGLWINLSSPLLLSVLSYIGITSYKFASEEKEKRWIKKAFSRYVAQDVMEEILKDPSKLTLGGERKELTVLFSDICGFTSFSEKRKPEEIVNMLNEYLEAMTQVIFENKGTLDKYVGDAIMVIFGAPKYEPPPLSAKRAVITACRMLDRLIILHEKWYAEGKEILDIGIGINTGDMVIGNMGSSLFMNYTVIGDAVNLGARLETATRKYNTHLIISESTYNYVKDIAEVKPLESIKVKGKEISVMIYEVLGVKILDGGR